MIVKYPIVKQQFHVNLPCKAPLTGFTSKGGGGVIHWYRYIMSLHHKPCVKIQSVCFFMLIAGIVLILKQSGLEKLQIVFYF